MFRNSLPIICAVALFLTACSSSEQKLELEIPPELQDNTEITALLNEMTTTVNKTRAYNETIITITKGKDLENSEELTTMQTIKLARVALQMMQAANDMEKYSIACDSLRLGLSAQQVLAFDAVREKLKIEMGDVDTENISVSKEDILAQQQQQSSQRAMSDSIKELREQAIEQMGATGYEDKPTEAALGNDNDEFKFWHLLFPVAVIGLIIYFIVRFIKSISSRFKNIRDYGIGGIKDSANEAFDKLDHMTHEEQAQENKKAEIEKMRDKFNTFFDDKQKS